MPDICEITGQGVDITGAVLPDATFRIDRVSGQTVTSGDAFSVGATFTAVTDDGGILGRIEDGDFVAGIDLVQGHTYRITPQRTAPAYGDLKAFFVFIDIGETSGTINDFIVPQPVPSVDQATLILQQAQAAADAAETAIAVASINAQTDDYTLVSGDAGKLVTVDAATDKTVTIPDDATAEWDAPVVITILRLGAGEVTIEAAAGVDLNGVTAGSASISEVYGLAQLIRLGADRWTIAGLTDEVAA